MNTATPATVVIAGYSEGLGSALHERFTAGGYRVIGVSRTNVADLHTDLSDPAATAELFLKIDRNYGPLAGVVHNAMLFHRQNFLHTRPDEFLSVWSSMVMTAVNISQQAIPRLRAGGGGVLIFSGASGSLRAGPLFSAFSSAKFALRGLAQALAREHRQDGIHVVHAVIDGLIWTDKTRDRFSAVQRDCAIDPGELAETYWHLFHQPRSAWTQELDIRPAQGSF